MIIVVEGPSAAGKSTWSRIHAGRSLIHEAFPAVDPPADAEQAAHFRAANGAHRWEQAVAVEQVCGAAVCDTDPLKLHYSWSLSRIGAEGPDDFFRQAAAYRQLIAHRRLGFADRYLVDVPDPDTLAVRKVADQSRRRRNFDLHGRLGPPLAEWYGMVETLRPGSVLWAFPDAGLSDVLPSELPRYDLETFDALVDRLGTALGAIG